MARYSKIDRNTKETNITLELELDGKGNSEIDTGVGFFDHMLTLFAFHGKMDLNIKAKGDLNVCDHHTVEDVGIALGEAFKKSIGDKNGINRYGTFYIPMDETLALASIDISNRPYLVFDCDFKREKVGEMATEMVGEFFRAFAFNAGVTLHLKVIYGENDHHKIEALFKALGRAIKEAKLINPENGLPSTKGKL
ncbi:MULTISPECIES: imidazoleglycerol-phosphate dehydratase HisB [Clostridium]|uniref:Imidazoleglycerol-phosphate dehydratase n=1 Tax=Clostridium carnis TaxID=1530 RepID=A0ABY6SUQ8_9CLOT|nr:imidazoleglycerol-phosphate dehydratase HisB [Clostridium carnis]CAI3625810.1 Imidazoleglycerol-phosphate dehydratase (IGPD) [Clostridium neonatale]CAI3629220.1 Imidazoleglycerol-phosphate dehydratase (IGPD) [Clostridium neonatale]CAI3663929.1 Imidazoleglycerol-phosphate dehydratase (IGPD) [Clostridium neonatale]CAI3676400.1 Imidazoleglycerol-phosphate dehydratase (IGPD) [Clostridium neonatale]VDG72250.1 imidazoleglycerol-phosphate dehydratase HisB [Clostridium carnis]